MHKMHVAFCIDGFRVWVQIVPRLISVIKFYLSTELYGISEPLVNYPEILDGWQLLEILG